MLHSLDFSDYFLMSRFRLNIFGKDTTEVVLFPVTAYQNAHKASLSHYCCKGSSLGLGVFHQVWFRGTFSALSLICFLKCDDPLRLCDYPILQQPFCILQDNAFSGISTSHILDLLSLFNSNKSKNLLNTVSQKETPVLLSHFSRVRPCATPQTASPPGSPVPGILQARTLEWVAISFSNAWK